MASFLNADLPSEDEADESFDPDAEAAAKAPKKKKETSRRGIKVGAADDAIDAVEQAKAAKRKASAASKFQELLQQSHKIQSKGSSAGAASKPPAAVPLKLAPSAAGSQEHRQVLSQKRPRHDPDAYWLQALGFVKRPKIESSPALIEKILAAATTDHIRTDSLEYEPAPIAHAVPSAAQPQAPQHTEPADTAGGLENAGEDSVMAGGQDEDVTAAAGTEEAEAGAQAASAALRSIAAGLHSADGAKKASMVAVKETRNFAGQEIEVTTEHHAGSKAAESAQNRASAAASKSGLDAALANISGPRKANTIDKSADDWKGFKSQNSEVKDELNEYNKSSDKYLEKQAFLKKAELTEYEKSRDQRLASDIRTRGRT